MRHNWDCCHQVDAIFAASAQAPGVSGCTLDAATMWGVLHPMQRSQWAQPSPLCQIIEMFTIAVHMLFSTQKDNSDSARRMGGPPVHDNVPTKHVSHLSNITQGAKQILWCCCRQSYTMCHAILVIMCQRTTYRMCEQDLSWKRRHNIMQCSKHDLS